MKSDQALIEALREVERHCPCGARPESLTTHPHVGGCPVARALSLAENLASPPAIPHGADQMTNEEENSSDARLLTDPPVESRTAPSDGPQLAPPQLATDLRYLRGLVRAYREHGATVFQPTNAEVLERVLADRADQVAALASLRDGVRKLSNQWLSSRAISETAAGQWVASTKREDGRALAALLTAAETTDPKGQT